MKNYYIQGSPARAEEIKAAFEEKGCTLYRLASNCDSEDLIYYSLNGIVRGTKKDNLYLFESNPNYKELELPVKPKFKIGDWIACDADSFTLSIKSVKDGNYYFHQGASLPIKDIDEHYHLWTIEDAKDGDVLYSYNFTHDCIFIFNGLDKWKFDEPDGERAVATGYCCLTLSVDNMEFGIQGPDCIEVDTVKPTTKKQRDMLFAKIKEAGYQWDADKKELCKIKHYDINNFYVGMPVLVRNLDKGTWAFSFFSHYANTGIFLFNAAGINWCQCIPFNDDTEHLLGTTDMPDEMYINW